MSLQLPLIDQRTAADIAKQVTTLLKDYATDWKEFDPATGEPVGMSSALIGVFSRYCEIIIQRLNQAAEKNFLAFLELLGASLQPPQPARVPLTFSLSAGSTEAAVVRAGTQVAAPPAEGETDTVIFETERDLMVTPAQLVSVFTRDPEQDLYADYSAITATADSQGVDIFTGNASIEHILYLGHSGLMAFAGKNLTLTFTLAAGVFTDARELKWEFWNGETFEEALPISDGTQKLTQSGSVAFTNIASVPPGSVNGKESRWMRCRLATPITIDTQARSGMVRSEQLPKIEAVILEASLDVTDQRLEKAFTGALAVDLGREFHPFGEKPKFGDTLYIASSEAFSQAQATVTLNVALINPADSQATVPAPAGASDDLSLRWEFWNGSQWTELTVTDETQKLTMNGAVSFTIPEQPSAVAINGEEGYWIRVRIITGNYGEEAKYVADQSQPGGYRFEPATFAPPIIDTIGIDYSLSIQDAPEAAFACNDFIYYDVSDMSIPFWPFQAATDTVPSLYFGFQLPAGRDAFPNYTVSMFNSVLQYNYDPDAAPPRASVDRLQLSWGYWNGTEWSALAVKDDSENFTRTGIAEFLPPTDFASSAGFGQTERFWLRVQWQNGEFAYDPKLCSVLLNTTMAAHTVTIKDEILGLSDESGSQKFQTVRKPVLTGQQIHVKEAEIPSADEQTSITNDEGDDAISVTNDAAGRPKEIWVRWHEVPDFYGSGPRDRHYVIDHLTGEIFFGDGQNGMIPPRGAGNIRMTAYQTGGGAAGNRPAGAITQMKTTVPYVEKAVNPEQASGGTDAETVERLYERTPRTIRHRNRCITTEDYQDVAMLASPEVARTLCVPLTDLSEDPTGNTITPGAVSVIIVPNTNSKNPLPSLELIGRVLDYLMEHAAATANISVVGPLYLRVDVTVEIALASLEGSAEVEMEVRNTLEKFLHPLTGGLDGKGWDFGREPYKSDLYAQIESVPGVDHVQSLTLDDTADDPTGAIKDTGRFLVYSGNHQISMVFV